MEYPRMEDKKILCDMLLSQKMITESYNRLANETLTPALRDEFLNLLSDEHKMESEIFDEIHIRGWYPMQMADSSKAQRILEKHQK